jgi:hypothetical protein
MSFPTELTNTATIEDTTPPNLTSVTHAPTVVNTESGPATVTVTLSGTDDLSGMRGFHVYYVSPSGYWVWGAPGCNGQSCTVSTELTFPQYSEAGIWRLSGITVHDAIGNDRSYDTTELAAMGVPTQLLNTSQAVSELVLINGGGTIDGKAGKRTSVKLWARVQNIGPQPASNVQVSFEVSADNGLTFTKHGGPVRVGNLASGDMGIATTKCALSPRDYVIRVTVDPGERVAEYAEGNNVLTFPLTVPVL